ncbi:MAG: hypothetical protein ACI39F_06390, partial [Acutalibacteraceae bacterium]
FEDAKVKQGIGYKYKVVALKNGKVIDTAVSKTSVKLSDLNVKATAGTVEYKIKFNEIAEADKYNIYVRKRMFDINGGKTFWEKENLNKDDNGTYYFFESLWDCYQFKVVALKNGKVIDTCYSDEKKPVDYSVKRNSYKWTKDRLKALGKKCNAYAQSLGLTTELTGTYAGSMPLRDYNFDTAFRRLKEDIDERKFDKSFTVSNNAGFRAVKNGNAGWVVYFDR